MAPGMEGIGDLVYIAAHNLERSLLLLYSREKKLHLRKAFINKKRSLRICEERLDSRKYF
jgi:hypothetical protein